MFSRPRPLVQAYSQKMQISIKKARQDLTHPGHKAQRIFVYHLSRHASLQPMFFLEALSSMIFDPCIHICLRIPASMSSRRRRRPPSCQPSGHQDAAMADPSCPSPEADWSLSPSRSPPPTKSEPPPQRSDPVWMQKTAKRLEAAASTAQRAAADGGADLKAMYVVSSAEIIQAASSQPSFTPISESWEYKERSSSQPRSHVEASYVLSRLTAGGCKKPEMSSGPFATALNPNRHTMMTHGRPVVVPRDENTNL